MSSSTRILAFAGSTRAGSSNRKLVRAAAQAAAGAHGKVTWIDLKDYALPLYDADLEAAGLPEALLRLRALVADHDGLILASPEYNGFFPPLLKNALDWLSRPALGQERHAVFAKLPVLLLSAVGGKGGGVNGLRQLHQQLVYLKAEPHAHQFILQQAGSAFDAQGRLLDPGLGAALADTVEAFVASVANVAHLQRLGVSAAPAAGAAYAFSG